MKPKHPLPRIPTALWLGDFEEGSLYVTANRYWYHLMTGEPLVGSCSVNARFPSPSNSDDWAHGTHPLNQAFPESLKPFCLAHHNLTS